MTLFVLEFICFRAFLFSYLEELLSRIQEGEQLALREHQRMTSFISESKANLVDIGYEEVAIETFHDVRCAIVVTLCNSAK